MNEKEKGDPKEDMKKEKALAMDSAFFFWQYDYSAFQRCQSEGAYKGAYKAQNIPPKAN